MRSQSAGGADLPPFAGASGFPNGHRAPAAGPGHRRVSPRRGSQPRARTSPLWLRRPGWRLPGEGCVSPPKGWVSRGPRAFRPACRFALHLRAVETAPFPEPPDPPLPASGCSSAAASPLSAFVESGESGPGSGLGSGLRGRVAGATFRPDPCNPLHTSGRPRCLLSTCVFPEERFSFPSRAFPSAFTTWLTDARDRPSSPSSVASSCFIQSERRMTLPFTCTLRGPPVDGSLASFPYWCISGTPLPLPPPAEGEGWGQGRAGERPGQTTCNV